jgi:hypothetical protein
MPVRKLQMAISAAPLRPTTTGMRQQPANAGDRA